MINSVILTGRLTTVPELKTTQSGLSVCSFDIAVDRAYSKGEEKQTDFIKIVAWRQTAEFVNKYFSKGSMIGVEGSIQTRKYQDKDGNNRVAFEIIANRVHFIESKKAANTDIQADPLPEFAQKVENLNNQNQNNLLDNTLDDDDDFLPF